MKKTFTILAASALAGAALAVDSPYSTEIVQLTNAEDTGLTETVIAANGKTGTSTGVYVDTTKIGSSGVSIKITGTADKKTYRTAYDTTPWRNEAAISLLNRDLGTSLSATNILNTEFAYTGAGGSNLNGLTVSFGSTSVYGAGDSIVMYLAVSGLNNCPTSVSVQGLESLSISYAQDSDQEGGAGFVSSISGATAKDLVLVRIEGRLTGSSDSTNNVVLKLNDGDKTGFGMFAIVPEPATATLSLLALAGLAARRRRK